MRKILVADDSRTNRLYLGQMVHSLGYMPVFASDGERAMRILEDNPDIACVLTDCQMPVMDGPALIRSIRAGGKPDLPVIAYSAYLGLKEVASLLETGATGFLNYPLKREDVKEQLDRRLSIG